MWEETKVRLPNKFKEISAAELEFKEYGLQQELETRKRFFLIKYGELDVQCGNCSEQTRLKTLKDGCYRQGFDYYLVLRCPKCWSLIGRIRMDDRIFNEFTIQIELQESMRCGPKAGSSKGD